MLFSTPYWRGLLLSHPVVRYLLIFENLLILVQGPRASRWRSSEPDCYSCKLATTYFLNSIDLKTRLRMTMTWVHNATPAVDAQSEWPTIIAVCISLTMLMATTVGLRLYVRAWMIKSVGVDDYVMLFSMVSNNSSCNKEVHILTNL